MMVTVRARDLVAGGVILSICLLAACSREQQDWRAAEGADTIKGYGQFIEHHPDSELTTEARTRIAQLGEDRDWQQAVSAGTASAFQQFLAQHPSGKWSQEARIRAESFALASVPIVPGVGVASPPTSPSAAPSSSPSAAAPTATPTAAATVPLPVTPTAALTAPPPTQGLPQTPASAAGFGIQLGAFSSEDKANSEWAALTSRFPSQLHGLTPHVVSADTTSGRLFRLQAAAASETLARTICDELKKQSQGCVPILPR
ncbi:MAG TPA: SPOR domain-containing protein [Steroidobacteraceae bacterium]|jgi:cell division septation protein DedD